MLKGEQAQKLEQNSRIERQRSGLALSVHVVFSQILHCRLHQIVVIAVQDFAQRPLGGHARPNAFQDAVDLVYRLVLEKKNDIGESTGISVVRRVSIEASPRTLQLAQPDR